VTPKVERHWPLRELVATPGTTTTGDCHVFVYGPLGVIYDLYLHPDWAPFYEAEARYAQEQYEVPVRLLKALMRAWDKNGRQCRVRIPMGEHEPVVEPLGGGSHGSSTTTDTGGNPSGT
jgi:hypothetical protein